MTTVTGHDATGAPHLLAMLADGSFVRGFVINRDAKNNPIIRTEFGDFVVESAVFIKTGSEVVLQTDKTKTTFASIVSIDHQKPEEYSTENTRAPQTDTITASAFRAVGQPSTAGKASPLPVLQAVLLQALGSSATPTATPAPGPLMPPALAQLMSGASLSVTVLDIELPVMPVSASTVANASNLSSLLPPKAPNTSGQATPAPSLPGALPPTLAAALLGAPVPTPAPALSPTQTLPTALPLSPTLPLSPGLQAVSTYAQSALATHIPAAFIPGSPTVIATVIGHGEDGTTIVHTPFGSLKLDSPQPLPSGTNIKIALELIAPGSVLPPDVAARSAATTPPFSYLGAALSQLMASDPAMARVFTAQLPTIGPKFVSGLLYFLSAVKSGERRGVFNPSETGRIETAAPSLLGQMSREVRELHQVFTNPPPEQWRPVTLPLIFGTQVELAQLYIKGEPQEQNGTVGSSQNGQRFLLDLHLSALGDMQLDGFVREMPRAKSLELYIRTADVMEPQFTQDIRSIFTSALEATGLTGHVVFEVGSERFAKPSAGARQSPDPQSQTILA